MHDPCGKIALTQGILEIEIKFIAAERSTLDRETAGTSPAMTAGKIVSI
jgi:hypothetical protein